MKYNQNQYVSNRLSLLLIYISIMYLITFLQQEFVLIPELQNLDIINDEIKADALLKFQRTRWLSFIALPIFLLIKLSLVTLCLYVGGLFFSEMSDHKYKEWWGIVVKAQIVMIIYGVILCILNIIYSNNIMSEVSLYSSLLFICDETTENWIKVPLAAVNIFEMAYWIVISKFVAKLVKTTLRKSFKFVMSTYGIMYFCYIVLLMFLDLYLG